MTPAADRDEEGASVLLNRWRAGDMNARDALLEQVHPIVYRWALSYASDSDEADDIAQHALLTVYRKALDFRAESPFGVWLYRVTMRSAGQRRRTLKRRERLSGGPRGQPDRVVYITDPGGRVDRERLTALVVELHRELPPRQRATLALVDLEGCSHSEAASMLQITPVTLRANLFKARAAIRKRVLASVPELAERFRDVSEPNNPKDT